METLCWGNLLPFQHKYHLCMKQFGGLLCSAEQSSNSCDFSEAVKSVCKTWDAQGLSAYGIT